MGFITPIGGFFKIYTVTLEVAPGEGVYKPSEIGLDVPT